MVISDVDWSAAAFQTSTSAGRTWHWLSELEASGGVPPKIADFVRTATRDVHAARAKATKLLRCGIRVEHQQHLEECARHLEEQRFAVMRQHISSGSHLAGVVRGK